jgi:hypothetical protein
MKKTSDKPQNEFLGYAIICLILLGCTLFYIWWNSPMENTLPEVYGVM